LKQKGQQLIEMGNGDVDRKIVIEVLRACGVAISEQAGENSFILEKNDVIEVYNLDITVSRRMIHHFSRKFSIPIHYFYNPRQFLPENIIC
jgi:hypothetical protein